MVYSAPSIWFSRQTLFMSMYMYLDLMSDMDMLTCSSIVVKSDVGVMDSPGYYIRFPPAVSLVLYVSVLCGLVSHTSLKYIDLLYFDLSLWKMNSIVSVPACFIHHWDRLPSLLRIELVHTGLPILTRSLYPEKPCSFAVDLVCHWFHCDCFFFRVFASKVVCAYVCFCICVASARNILCAF